ncbi:MAG: DUF1786 domain-containing protein [Bacillota bacterium]
MKRPNIDGILAVDVGGGTQDILVYRPGVEMENNVKLILPSQTQIVAKRIERLTNEGKDIFIHGHLMGGGSSSGAVKNHIQAGYNVYATRRAAMTIKDNLEEVTARGIRVVDSPPKTGAHIKFKDIDILALRESLKPFEIELPSRFAFAVQDHGFSPDRSNRQFRFEHWQKFLSAGGNLADLIYDQSKLPVYFTRMEAVMESCREEAEQIWLMDTGSAAIMGTLEDPKVKEAVDQKGAMLVNVGNQHTIAFLVAGSKVYGVFEHHTGILTSGSLLDYLTRFREGSLTNEEVFVDHGHGCVILPAAKDFSFDFTAVTGPRRSLAKDIGYMAVPHGDMMISGPAGLVRSVLNETGNL